MPEFIVPNLDVETYWNSPVAPTTHVHPSRFEFRNDGRWPRLQRLVTWVARKLKMQAVDVEMNYQRVTIDYSHLLQGMYLHRRDVECHNNRRAKYLVVGRDMYPRLHMEAVRHMVVIDPTRFPSLEKCGDLIVVFVPWINGCFILPELP